ncbi:hypothetical protein Cyrtocomes_00132 [Candidatus Cyrtobacter comes]|uniref:Uncharacterized protein n=1 Tax=Candidatus Cyrtobacter comes TaxID=675776 RepID=A0ABU5L6M2_9RICK|nr:hypothetical protein [Candidatus Cyrtobacter comes]MDZ5761774.1 hypothetical protein [Candidatus Cyrtobacter comes]
MSRFTVFILIFSVIAFGLGFYYVANIDLRPEQSQVIEEIK